MRLTESQLRRIIRNSIREALESNGISDEKRKELQRVLDTNPNQPHIDKDEAIERLMKVYMDQGISEQEAWAIASAKLQGY